MATETRLTIRAFRPSDLPAVKALIHRAILACYPGHYCPEAVRFFTNYHSEEAILRDAQEGRTFILDRAGRIVGTGTLTGDEIQRVAVDPVFHRQGFGRRIMQYLERIAARHGVATVKLHASLPAKLFYDRLGYATVEAAFRPVENGQRLDFFKMQKDLSCT